MTVLTVPSCTGAQGLNAPEMFFSTPGQELVSEITLDQAPEGISGYDIAVSLDPPGSANITRVEYPEWAMLTQTSPLPAGTVRIVAGNIQGSPVPESGSVILVRIYVVSSAEGTITPEIVSAIVDNYAGDAVVSMTSPGTIPTVTASSEGMGSISYTGPEVNGGSEFQAADTQNIASASPAAEISIGTTTPGTGIVTAEQTSENVIEAAPATHPPVPTTVPGPGPIAVMCAVVIVAILITGNPREN